AHLREPLDLRLRVAELFERRLPWDEAAGELLHHAVGDGRDRFGLRVAPDDLRVDRRVRLAVEAACKAERLLERLAPRALLPFALRDQARLGGLDRVAGRRLAFLEQVVARRSRRDSDVQHLLLDRL